VPRNFVLALTLNIETRLVSKFRSVTSPNSEIIKAHLLQFKPIFDFILKKVVSKPPSPVNNALVKLGHFLARVKIWERNTP